MNETCDARGEAYDKLKRGENVRFVFSLISLFVYLFIFFIHFFFFGGGGACVGGRIGGTSITGKVIQEDISTGESNKRVDISTGESNKRGTSVLGKVMQEGISTEESNTRTSALGKVRKEEHQ